MSEGAEVLAPAVTPEDPEYAPAIDGLLNPPRVQQSNQFLTEDQRRMLFETARSLMPAKIPPQHRIRVLTVKMDHILEVASAEPASLGETLGMLLLWGAGVALAVLAALHMRGIHPHS